MSESRPGTGPATAEGLEPGAGAGDPAPRDWFRLVLLVVATMAILVWASIPTLLVIAALIFMIFMHELGHYLTAKAAGMKVTEFFIGFGPRLWSFRRGETEYGFKAIPAGAYVRIIGMSNLETDVDPAEEHRTYRQKPYWRRLSVALAGSAMHFLMALVLMFTLLSVLGTPDYDSDRWKVAAVSEGSSATDAGILPGDRVVAVDGKRFDTFGDLSEYLRGRPGREVELTLRRDGEERVETTRLGTRTRDGEEVGFLGIGPEYDRIRVDPLEGAVDAVTTTGQTMWLSIEGLGAFFSFDGLSGYLEILTEGTPAAGPGEVEGEGRLLSPVGAVRIASEAASTGLAELLFFLFLINVFVGVFNLLPLLPFDGGHVAVATYEAIRGLFSGRRYHADVSRLLPLTYAVVLVLVLIGVTALFLDLRDPISLPQ